VKALLAFAVLLTLGATAVAKPTPVDRTAKAISSGDSAVAIGAMMEADYFRAPRSPDAAGRAFPCRLKMHIFDKTRLAQSCN
jgi:hypothetical protein